MKYTESAKGLLTKQYQSVLKKCFMINIGLFVFICSATAADKTLNLADYTNHSYGMGDNALYYKWGTQDYLNGFVAPVLMEGIAEDHDFLA